MRDEIPVLVRALRPRDRAAVRAILGAAGLDPVIEPEARAVVADSAGQVVAVAALATLGSVGLLRSVAVAPSWRGRGIGARLVADRLADAAAQGLGAVYLLTEGAAGFFAQAGFAAIPREEAPDALRAHPQFTTACPRSATLMARACG